MTRYVAAVVVLALTIGGATAQPKAKSKTKGKKAAAAKIEAPTTPPPRFMSVAAVNKKAGQVELSQVISKFVWEERTVEREKDGKVETVTVKICKPVYEMVAMKAPVAEGRVFDAAGKAVKPADAWKGLKVGTVVLVSSDGEKVHSAYRKLVKKDTLILLLPLDPAPAAPPSVPKPAPKQPKAALRGAS